MLIIITGYYQIKLLLLFAILCLIDFLRIHLKEEHNIDDTNHIFKDSSVYFRSYLWATLLNLIFMLLIYKLCFDSKYFILITAFCLTNDVYALIKNINIHYSLIYNEYKKGI